MKIITELLAYVVTITFLVIVGYGIFFLYKKIFKKGALSKRNKKIWLITLIVFVVSFIGMIMGGNAMSEATLNAPSSSSSEYSSSSESSESEDDEEESSESLSEPQEESFNAGSYRTDITYDSLARTPEDYVDKKLTMAGKVLQVMNNSDVTQLRVAINSNYDDVVLVEIDNSDLDKGRILENDLITFYGTSNDMYTYEGALGQEITIPSVLADKIVNQGKAADE